MYSDFYDPKNLMIGTMIKHFYLVLFFCLTAGLSTAQLQKGYLFRDTRMDAEKRIENLISLMTLEEKINAFGGGGVTRLGVPGAGSVEAIHGIVLGGPAWDEKQRGPKQYTTVFPQGYGLGATWDTHLLKQVAVYMSYEARFLFQNPHYKKGGIILWTPNADLGRDIRWGRTEECYGEDPYLTGELVAAKVRGLQGDHPRYWRTASLMKHFLANSHEFGRTETSSDFDDALFREYYAYPFYKGILAGSNALMTAYNASNGIPCTYHPVLKDVLQKEWKFNGIILTDGGAFQQLKTTHKRFDLLEDAAGACIRAGTTRFLDDYKAALTKAIEKGIVTEKELETNIRGNLRVMLKLGLLDDSTDNPYSKIGLTDTVAPWTKQETKDFVRKVAAKSVVLLKNEGRALPLRTDNLKRIAVIGNRADEVIEDWYSGTPAYKVSALQGIRNAVAGMGIEIKYARNDKMDEASKAAAWADVAIVCVGNEPTCSPEWTTAPWGKSVIAGEGREDVDRTAITLEQEDLIKIVNKANPNTVVALISSFPYAIEWTQANVPAIVHITQSCQELGNGLADVIFGKVNPAGRTTQTWVKSIDQLPPMLDYNIRNGRTYMYFGEEPLYPFGHGLSYSSFEYSDLNYKVKKKNKSFEISVSLDVSNTGSLPGDEVVQLYVKLPGDDARQRLRGFCREHLIPGEKKRFNFTLLKEDLQRWDVYKRQFYGPDETFEIFVGASSADIRLSQKINL